MNRMKQVAEMLGVELGELFKIEIGGEISEWDYVMWENGLCAVYDDKAAEYAEGWLETLITGEAKIIKKPWRPKFKETYYYWERYNCFDKTSWKLFSSGWIGEACDISIFAMGNCFKSEEEAEAHKDEVIKLYTDVLRGIEE